MMIHASITAGASLFSLVELLLTGHFERQDDLEVNVLKFQIITLNEELKLSKD